MRYLLISDIHSNLEALQATIEHAKQYEPFQLMCLGDVVGYGADPQPCIDLVGDHANLMLAGNHDLAVAGVIKTDDFNAIARRSVEWTREQLSAEDRELLGNLPLQYVDGDYCYTHASPLDPMRFTYIRTLEEVGEVFAHIGQLRQPQPQMMYARLRELLPLEGRLVFGVLTQVAVRARLLDLFRQHKRDFVIQAFDFGLELLLESFDHTGY